MMMETGNTIVEVQGKVLKYTKNINNICENHMKYLKMEHFGEGTATDRL